MSRREAHSKTVPSPFYDDGSGYRAPGKCPLCSRPLNKGTVIYWHLPTDPDDLRRCVHALCAQEYGLFRRALERIAEDVTPAS